MDINLEAIVFEKFDSFTRLFKSMTSVDFFQNVVDLLKGIVTGDMEKIKEAAMNLGKNIIKAIKDGVSIKTKDIQKIKIASKRTFPIKFSDVQIIEPGKTKIGYKTTIDLNERKNESLYFEFVK